MIWIYVSLVFGAILVAALAGFAYLRLAKNWSLKSFFKDFKRKMWMTIALGSVFFSLYLLIVSLFAWLIPHWDDLFFLIDKNPVQFVYAGLCVFAFFSMSIYFVRMIIKYVYLTRSRE